jgi:hypothetical protein
MADGHRDSSCAAHVQWLISGAVLFVLAFAVGCSTSRSPEVVVSYAGTPGSAIGTATPPAPVAARPAPTSTRARKVRTPSPSAQAETPGDPPDAESTSSDAASSDAPGAAPTTAQPASSPVVVRSPATTASKVTPIPGSVPESQGQFVTSDSRDAKDYYALADSGWHRIHPDHRVWFATEADLLRAFPGRALHPSRSPGSTPTPASSAM